MSETEKRPQSSGNGPLVSPKQEDGAPRLGRRDKRRNPVLVKQITDAVLAGNSYATACALVGISYRVFFLWMAEGRRLHESGSTKGYKVQFFQGIVEAEAKAIHRNVMVIQQAARRDWKAAAWYLERRNKDEWGLVNRVEQAGPSGGPIEVKDVTPVPELSKAEILRLLAILESNAQPTDTTEQPGTP